jgi:hypothetical protein
VGGTHLGYYDGWLYDRLTAERTVIPDFPPDNGGACGDILKFVETRDVSACGGKVVGRALSGGDAETPRFEAFLWTPAAGTVGLGDFQTPSLRSFARAIHPDRTLIVGAGRDPNLAIPGLAAIWERDLQIQRLHEWAAARGIVFPASRQLLNGVDIRQVGDRVFICGTVIELATTTYRPYLMKVPFENIDPCPADILPQPNGDGVVNVTDLLILLAAWGPYTESIGCRSPDIAPPGGDGFVNVTDLLALLAAWGPCF